MNTKLATVTEGQEMDPEHIEHTRGLLDWALKGVAVMATFLLGLVGWNARRQVSRLDALEKKYGELMTGEEIIQAIDDRIAPYQGLREEFRADLRMAMAEHSKPIRDELAELRRQFVGFVISHNAPRGSAGD